MIAGDGQVTTTAAHPRGYDKATGKEVGAVLMPAPQSGSPMTYMLTGKQYIIVAESGGAYSGEYIAFTLPEERGRARGSGLRLKRRADSPTSSLLGATFRLDSACEAGSTSDDVAIHRYAGQQKQVFRAGLPRAASTGDKLNK